jgi:hypothetical protein
MTKVSNNAFCGFCLFKGIGYILGGALGLVGKIGKLALGCLFKREAAVLCEPSLLKKTVTPLSPPQAQKQLEESVLVINSMSAPQQEENMFAKAAREEQRMALEAEALFNKFYDDVRVKAN